MATCPMCNAEDVSDDPNDMTGHDMNQHEEKKSGDQVSEDTEDQS